MRSSAALHAGGGDHPDGAARFAAARRFGVTHRLDYYGAEDLVAIVQRSARLLGVEPDGEGKAARAGVARHAARRQPTAAPGARLRPSARPRRSTRRREAASSCSGWTPRARGTRPQDVAPPRGEIRGRPVGLGTLAAASARRPTRSRTSTSRTPAGGAPHAHAPGPGGDSAGLPPPGSHPLLPTWGRRSRAVLSPGGPGTLGRMGKTCEVMADVKVRLSQPRTSCGAPRSRSARRRTGLAIVEVAPGGGVLTERDVLRAIAESADLDATPGSATT